MSKFIPVEKIRKLREAARSGDIRAKKILDMQLGGEEDFSGLLEEYFAPAKPEPVEKAQPLETSSAELAKKSKLQEFLEYNDIKDDSPEYDEYVEMFYQENPNEPREDRPHHEEAEECPCKEELNKLKKEELDAINSYSKAITLFMENAEMEDSKKRRVIARLKEIRADEEEHFKELGELLAAFDEIKEEEQPM